VLVVKTYLINTYRTSYRGVQGKSALGGMENQEIQERDRDDSTPSGWQIQRCGAIHFEQTDSSMIVPIAQQKQVLIILFSCELYGPSLGRLCVSATAGLMTKEATVRAAPAPRKTTAAIQSSRILPEAPPVGGIT